ncbi:unnamed protein product [Paramecium primaurelia]|uniref:Transmembrane protein n=1 Tax=Paramecium primaurelia TaxID=5886 RepID=A0A8S1KQ58_PARPR|nr:unnamed protein product [Paramecium primaurelia]
MYLIALFIITIQAEILQFIPNNLNYLYPTTENECKNIELKQNQYFYQDINKETNIIYRYANDFYGLINDKWNLTFIDLIYKDQFAPIFYYILQTQYLKFNDKEYICSLLQDQANQNYQINCKQANPYKYIDNQPQFKYINELSFIINYEEGFQCNSFIFLNDVFLILCSINDHIIINTFDLIGNKQSYQFPFTNKQCKSKFNVPQDRFILVSFYQCEDWEILYLDVDLNFIKKITNQQVIKIGNIYSYKYLQNVHNCYNQLFLIFDQEYIEFNALSFLSSDFDPEAGYFKIQEQKLLIILSCQNYNQFISEKNINSIINDIQTQDLKQVATLGSFIILLQYPDNVVAIITKEIQQIINIKINQINNFFIGNQIFIIVDQSNILHIFKANLFYNHLLYQKQGQYLGFYKLANLNVTLVQCFNIFEDDVKNDKLLQVSMQNLKKQNYMIQINGNFNQIWIDKFNIFFNMDVNFSFNFTNIFSIKKEQTQNYKLSQVKQLKMFGQFYLFQIKQQIYIMFNQEDQNIKIYNFNTSRLEHLNLRLNLNLIKIYYVLKDIKFVLVEETLKKIIIFKSSEIQQDMITYQIYQFKQEIRISFLYRNLISLQLENSTEVLFENENKNTFLNQSLHYYSDQDKSNLNEHIQGAVKVLNFHNIFIFQYEQHIKIQIGNSDTIIINQKLLLLGGYFIRKNPMKLILLGMNQEMNIMDKYLINQLKFLKLSTFNFSNYIPILPLCYQVMENIIIILTKNQDQDLFHILLFNMEQQSNFEYYDIVSTPYQYFYVLSGFLYYYNHNKELIEYNIYYLSIDIEQKELNQIVQKEQFQLDLYDSSDINAKVYSEKLNLLILNSQYDLQLINQTNSKIIMQNNFAQFNPYTFVKGNFYEFKLINTTFYYLQTPFRFVNRKSCHYFIHNLCIIEETPFFIVQDLTKDLEQNQTLPIAFTQQMQIYKFNEGFLIIQQQSQSKFIKISYYKQNIESIVLIEDVLIETKLIQQILMVFSYKQTNYYFINDSITLIQSFQKEVQFSEHFLYHQIDFDKISQIIFQKNQINIHCFQIKSGLTYKIQNYTIPTTEIYNSIDLCHYLPNFIQNIQFRFLNLSQILKDELDLKIVVFYKLELLFYFQIILKHQEYQIKLNNIIRLPNFNIECQSILIQNNLLYYCESFSLFLYELQSGFQLLNPYAAHFLNTEIFSQLNNTHIALYNFKYKIITIYTIDQWRLVKNDNVSIDNEQNITFIVKNQITQLEFRVNIVNQIEDDNYYKYIKIGIVVINNIFIQIFIIIFKKQKK